MLLLCENCCICCIPPSSHGQVTPTQPFPRDRCHQATFLLPSPSILCTAELPACLPLGWGVCPAGNLGGCPVVLPLQQGKVTGEGCGLYEGQPAGEGVFGMPAVPSGQMRGRSYIWKVPFGSLPGCCSKLSPELALTLRVQLPSTSIPLPGPTPHSAPFFPPAFLSCGL